MNEDKLQRTIDFILQNQADSVAQNAIISENFKRLQERQDKFQDRLEELAKLTHDLVAVAQMHSRRLDRLEGIQPH